MTAQSHEARRAELVRRLTELAPKKKLDAMLEEVDGRALVRSIPAEEVYSAIIDVGLVDSTEIVQLSTPDQFRTYVDLAAWQKDRIDVLEVLHWLRAARGDDDEEYLKKLQRLDLEVVELMFKRLTRIHDLQEDPDVDTEGVPVETPEGKFLVEVVTDGVDEHAMRQLVKDFMAHNPFELTRFLEAVRWEMPTELEETAFQFRQARLQDLGFPPLDEALKVFAWNDPDKVQVVAPAPGLLRGGERVDYVAAMFKGLDAIERQNLEGEVRYLVNCVLVAEGAEPGDPPALRRLSEQARDTLELGLELLTGGDPDAAAAIVRGRPLKEIFQLGFSLTLKVKRQVERLSREPGSRFGDTWLALDEETAALQALMRRRPLKALKVPGAEPVTFRSRKELAEVDGLLARVRHQRAIFGALLGASPAETIARFGAKLSELTPQRLFLAVVARAEVDGVVDVAPFPELRVQELVTRLFDEQNRQAVLRPSAGKRALEVFTATLADGHDELEGMVTRALAMLLDDVGRKWVEDGRVDPKKVVALPIAGQPVIG
ncbi:MAG: DUF6178 family protein [Myxococcaceae bacterium]|nr:DUF6178 family protein [Myxococcaceae bacterium]